MQDIMTDWQLSCPLYNNFMSENRPQRIKNENLKTEASQLVKTGEVELGKPVKLPYIRKISTNANPNSNFSRKSLEGKDTRVMRNSNKELQLLEQTHLNLLTLQEIELCNERSREKAEKPEKDREREGFPRILLPNPLFARQRSIDSLDNPHRLRSEKSITKLDFSECLKDYRLGPILGRGTYSVVRVARNRQGKKFAVKAYLRSALSSEDRKANLESQIQILERIQHPSIPAYQETIQTEEAIHIVTELCENRSLAEWVRQGAQGEAAARGVAKQVGKALEYLHSLEIVHRDLKMENILVGRQGRLKLIDFGFSRQLPRETFMLYDFCGTPHYIAPEVIQREGYFGKPADIWSLGVILYRMAVGSFPFKGNTEKTLFLKVVKGDLKLPPELSPELSSLLGRMLNFDYRKRPTAQELSKDEWVSK